MRLRYIDTFSYKTAHVQFNASLLAVCSYIFKNIKYYACESNASRVMELLNEQEKKNIQHKKVYVVTGDYKMSLLLRYFVSAVMNVVYLILSKKNDVIIYNFDNALSLHMINAVNRIMHRKVLICCHSELELMISGPNDGGLQYKLLRKSVISFFVKKRSFQRDIHYAVIGDAIYRNLKGIVNDNVYRNFIVISHPYIFRQWESNGEGNNNGKVNIGTVGVFNRLKGADIFYNMVRDLNATLKDKVNFSITGRIFYDTDKLKEENVWLPKNEGSSPLDGKEFSERISDLDYILYMYDNNSYKLTASGALLDAIYYNKPVIAMRNDYFKYFFEKYGNIGYLAKDIDEMKQIITDIALGKQERPGIDFERIKEELSPRNNCHEIEQELKKIDFLNK